MSESGINFAGGNSFARAASFASDSWRSPNHGFGSVFSGIGGLTSSGEKGLSPISRFPFGVGRGSPMGRVFGDGFGVSGVGVFGGGVSFLSSFATSVPYCGTSIFVGAFGASGVGVGFGVGVSTVFGCFPCISARVLVFPSESRITPSELSKKYSFPFSLKL